jgi:hypothetical protein
MQGRSWVKRLAVITTGVLTTIATSATFAMAQQYPPSKTPFGDGSSTPGEPVAFTGANISLGMIIVIALVVVGTVLLLATRRRRVVSGK